MEGLNRDLWDLVIFGIGDASCVGILLYNTTLCASVLLSHIYGTRRGWKPLPQESPD